MKVSATFPKSKRLLKHADFDRVYREGRRNVSRNLSVFYLPGDSANNDGVRVGITVGKALGGAVARNRIKRRMREVVRRHLSELTGALDVVINPRKSAADMEFAELEKEVAAAFAKIERAPRGLVQIRGAKGAQAWVHGAGIRN